MSAIDSPVRYLYKKVMFGISGEHILILGIVLLIFGPRRLPELGNTMGKAIKNFKDAISGVEEAKFRKLPAEGTSSPLEANVGVNTDVKAEVKVAAEPAVSSQPNKA